MALRRTGVTVEAGTKTFKKKIERLQRNAFFFCTSHEEHAGAARRQTVINEAMTSLKRLKQVPTGQ